MLQRCSVRRWAPSMTLRLTVIVAESPTLISRMGLLPSQTLRSTQFQRLYSDRLPIHRNSPLPTSKVLPEGPTSGDYTHPPPPKSPRSLRPYIWSSFFLLLGLTAGQLVRLTIAPPAYPVPGSPEDQILVASIRAHSEKLPIVQELGGSPAWRSWEAYSNFSPELAERRITSGSLAGARGLGACQRIFYNPETGEVVNVVWFGGGLAGWPGVTHGGLIATVMDETLGRAAIRRFPAQSGVTANLNLTYKSPSVSNAFYVVRAWPIEEGSTDTKRFVQGRLETPEGKVCVEAKGLFVVPKKVKLQELPEGF